jgi:transcriptional regulator GlxA family with amidase domain
MRLFLEAARLEGTDRTTGSVAAACGYATKHALRRAMRELLGGEMPAREEVWEAAARGRKSGVR